jgi:hypothetical protein
MADNWYVVLELSFDPPVEDEKVIEERIQEKSKFWSSKFNDYKNGAQYRIWHQNLAAIRKDMIGPANIRAKLAAEACDKVYGPIDMRLKTMSRKGYITSGEVDGLAKQQKVSPDVVKRRAQKLGIKLVASQTTDYQAVYDKYYKSKTEKAPVFDGLKPMLASFGAKNLYEFLYAGTDIKDPSKLPCDKLRQRASEKKSKEYYKHDPVSGTGSKLCGQCELTFKDEASKEAYDRYLEYNRRKEILDYARSVSEVSSGGIDREVAEEIIGQLTQIFRDRNLAKQVLESFCKVEKIACNLGTDDKDKRVFKVCRCGCTNDVSDGRKVCQNCGLELEILCPNCGAKNDVSVKVCRCGFRFENIDKAIALCELADHAIDSLSFDAAQANLSDAERFWPKNPKTAPLRQKLKEFRERVGGEVAKMNAAVAAKRYWEARSQYASIRRLFPRYSAPELEAEINTAIGEAQKRFTQAKAAKSEKEILELCAQAYEYCSDLPGVKELIPPPPPVAGLRVEARGTNRMNVVSWTPQNDKSVRYVIIRSDSGTVRNKADGTEIYRGSSSSFADKAIQPGVPYYYNVFAERAGICSQSASGDLKGVVNLFEISRVGVAAADGSLNIQWETLPVGATAEIYRVEQNGTEKYLASSQAESYLVSGLQNEKQYTFHVFLTYNVSGDKKKTPGVVVSGIPIQTPWPAEGLRIKPVQEGTFEAVWTQKESGDVRLFGSTRKPNYLLGDIIPVNVLESEMRAIQHLPLSAQTRQTLKSGEHGVSFTYNGTDVLYVVAAVVKAGSAVFGSVARASLGQALNVKSIRPVNGKIYISLDPPRNATGFRALYRFDRFPGDADDEGATRKDVTLREYERESAIVVDALEAKKYYFTVFAEFRDGMERDYSPGTDYLFDNSAKTNITYSITPNIKRWGGESSVTLEFKADQTQFTLPAIDVMSAVGNAPMFKKSAKLFHSIPAQAVDGSVQIRIPLPKSQERNTYIKAFLKNEADQSRYQIKLALHSSLKIN